ncbi:MAG: tRNA (N(6)-L-threonylcarbamoyladenosine(37)-C(2))-methylthiotransferase MtaB [Pirellulaceae bacterium]|nr:MAG: tRNA (N(6)-L-threonylcarbamoyladenosine(37)-C(2))-methylthiotransferase MtaB [Pirellulaceae bacterium]
MATLRTYTLGCKVNQYETELVREGLLRIGYRDAEPGETADLCVINSCTVTGEADSKSRQAIRRLIRQNPAARVVVMGCYATRAPDEVRSIPGVSEVITDKREIPDWLGRFGVRDLPDGISRFGHRHRAYIKIQDGCYLRCTYCIIPQVRPHVSSRPVEEIVREVRRLVANGYREIVLTGIHLGHYGVDRNLGKPKAQWVRLSTLLQELVALPEEFRIRLSSMEATEVTDELLEVMAAHPHRICPHLHICLQSGSDAVLRRMRRRWGVRRFLDRVRLVRSVLDQPCLTTDVIVGFPGETEDDFQQTLQACREAGFAKIHIFPFSPRRGTPAAQMPDPVPPEVCRERIERLARCERQLRQRYLESLLGRSLDVLVESPAEPPLSGYAGTSCRYMPVVVRSDSCRPGELVRVRPAQINREVLVV